MNPLYEAVKDVVVGACSFCSTAYGVKNKVEKTGVNPSVRSFVADGFQVMTF